MIWKLITGTNQVAESWVIFTTIFYNKPKVMYLKQEQLTL